ncbi:hypothetical protein J6590_095419, partial [Homalodisca vitripennis]
WNKYYEHVITVEREYSVKDGIMEDSVNKMMIRIRGDSDSLCDVEINYITDDFPDLSDTQAYAVPSGGFNWKI